MLIEVSGNSRPAKPALAVIVTALLLVLTIGGAAWLTRARNHPISLGQVHAVDGIPGVRIAWPEDWKPRRLPTRPGAPIVAVEEGEQQQRAPRVLILLAKRVADEAVAPEDAVRNLVDVTRQLGFRPAALGPAAETTMAGLPAIEVRYPVRYQDEVWWLQMRTICEPNGRAIGLILLCPDQITPSDERVMDVVGESMKLVDRAPAKKPPADAEEERPVGQPI